MKTYAIERAGYANLGGTAEAFYGSFVLNYIRTKGLLV